MPSHRHQIVRTLTGQEVFMFLTGMESEQHISAADLKSYCGGDVGVPAIRPERGAHPVKVSGFPNAEFNMGPGDMVTGLQRGLNVNFSFEQIVEGVMKAMAKRNG